MGEYTGVIHRPYTICAEAIKKGKPELASSIQKHLYQGGNSFDTNLKISSNMSDSNLSEIMQRNGRCPRQRDKRRLGVLREHGALREQVIQRYSVSAGGGDNLGRSRD